MRRVRAFWKALRAWIAAKHRRDRMSQESSPPLSNEIKNPLRLNNAEYEAVMKELDEVLASKENSPL